MFFDQQQPASLDVSMILYPDFPQAAPAIPISQVREKITLKGTTTGTVRTVQGIGDQNEM